MPIDTDDLEPRRKKSAAPDFDRLSVEELHEMIEDLEAQIVKAREVIAAKTKARGAASSVFKF
jgi:uncharacterized small protein (DUF1192 family)